MVSFWTSAQCAGASETDLFETGWWNYMTMTQLIRSWLTSFTKLGLTMYIKIIFSKFDEFWTNFVCLLFDRELCSKVLKEALLLLLLFFFLLAWKHKQKFHEKNLYLLHSLLDEVQTSASSALLAEQCFHEISGIQFGACPFNLWKSIQCVHEISGIHSVSTKLVVLTMCPQNWWIFLAEGIVLHLYCFRFTFKKRLHLELIFQNFYSFCHVFKHV